MGVWLQAQTEVRESNVHPAYKSFGLQQHAWNCAVARLQVCAKTMIARGT